jgi:hypothetical protein
MKMIGISRFAAASSHEIEAALARQSDIDHQASGAVQRIGFEKVGNGGK